MFLRISRQFSKILSEQRIHFSSSQGTRLSVFDRSRSKLQSGEQIAGGPSRHAGCSAAAAAARSSVGRGAPGSTSNVPMMNARNWNINNNSNSNSNNNSNSKSNNNSHSGSHSRNPGDGHGSRGYRGAIGRKSDEIGVEEDDFPGRGTKRCKPGDGAGPHLQPWHLSAHLRGVNTEILPAAKFERALEEASQKGPEHSVKMTGALRDVADADAEPAPRRRRQRSRPSAVVVSAPAHTPKEAFKQSEPRMNLLKHFR
eukprot:TRINITY_DN13857_c0_g1_i1.p1 TRINITY_DN13857_c0_g1~~TRINITY_DN13857_c0_g1_i1.p1  ORF type:complete len:256 (+),score=44.79 TRINITY_DN13857_c0_g1_i1:21-788(+)